MTRVLTAAGAFLLLITVLAAPSQAADYKLDKGHTYVYFKVKHMDIGYSYGRFNEFDGSFSVDGEDSKFNFTVMAKSVDTGIAKRDDHLRSPDYFNVAQFPVITFKSTKVKVSGDEYHVTGNLTFMGVTKPVMLKLTKTGEGERRGNYLIGFDGEMVIKRSEFNMKAGGLGDEVKLAISFEGSR